MTIRRAQVADIPALEKLLKEILLVHHQARPDLFRASGKKFSRQQLEALVPDDSKPIFVYEDEQGKILGHLFIIIENTEGKNSQPHKTLFIDDLCVAEDARGQRLSQAVKAESWLAFNNPIMMFVIYGSIIALSWFAAHFITDGTMTTGNLTSMFSYVMSMMMALMMLSMIFVMVSMSAASARRIAEVLNEKADITNPENPVREVPDGRIDFNHVNFTYKKDSDKDALEDIDIHINAGETIGIIGGTGCGKSSFVNLISRLYDVKDGSVCVGGIDVRDYDLETLRNEVSVVLQKNVLFSGTILDNLRWGDENASEEDCIEACRQACADEFIERMPDKYNTWIEQGGSNVSGGQRQRLCIARALLKHPKVLILDDSTSAVDTATDAKIKKAFATKIPGTTKIIVSQRISSIQDADRILVLENGCVSGFDTHENLVENNKVYREIYEVQTQGGGDFDEAGE